MLTFDIGTEYFHLIFDLQSVNPQPTLIIKFYDSRMH